MKTRYLSWLPSSIGLLLAITLLGVAIARIADIVVPPLLDKEKKPTAADYFVAKVLFAETLGTSRAERHLVASVMQNRIGHRGFGRGLLRSMEASTRQPGAFQSINDPNNASWRLSNNRDIMSHTEKLVFAECLMLAKGDFQPASCKSGRPLVYFHDKSITKPESWDNRWWLSIKEIETEHFIFYSVIPNP